MAWPPVPTFIFYLLFFLDGGALIHRALAQGSGWPTTPVAFSLGWFTYSVSSLYHVFYKQKLMPEPDGSHTLDTPCTVIKGETGSVHRNLRTWTLQRVLRDFDVWKPSAITREVQSLVSEAAELNEKEKEQIEGLTKEMPVEIPVRKPTGFCISIFRTVPGSVAGIPALDWFFVASIIFTILQLLISAVPYILYGQWTILMVTASGTLLAFLYGVLPQWRKEKWDCRRRANIVALTEGHMADHVIVIIGDENALDLNDLAESAAAAGNTSLFTRFCFTIFALAWVVILYFTMAIQQNVCYLLAVCMIGVAQNAMMTSAPRDPSAFGLHLDFVEVVKDVRVVKAFMKLEAKYPTLGANLQHSFFPGPLSEEEWAFWCRKMKSYSLEALVIS